MQPTPTIQIGKKGVPENINKILENYFKNSQNLKIVFLKTATRNKGEIKQKVEEIIGKLGKNYTYRIIGFTVFMKKWRRIKNL